jgi:hypothetical protein
MMNEELLELAGVLMMSLAALAVAACAIRFGTRGMRLLLVFFYCAIALCMMPEPVNPLQYWLTHRCSPTPSGELWQRPTRYNSVAPTIERLFL